MLSLLRMEIYRAKKSKSNGITLLIIGLLSFFSVFSSTMGAEKAGSINIFQQFISILSTPLLLIIWSTMISVYISGEYKNGFIKSIAGQIPNRGYLALSKLLFFTMYTIEMFITSFVFVVISAFVFGKNNVVFGFSSQVIVLLFVQILLYVGFSSVFILISIVTRSSSLGIGLGISIGCGLNSIIYLGINWVVNKVGIISNFDFGGYMIETNIQYMQVGIPNELILRAMFVGIFFMVATTFASAQVLKKRDI